MGEIFKDKTVSEVLKQYDCAIGLDISRRSTGVALYQNGVLILYQIITEVKYSKTDTMWEANMKREFKNSLKSIVNGKEFDIAVVENTINGCNAITNKELVLLNSVFDDLVADGVCKVKKARLVRPLPNVWRKELKQIKNVGKEENTKVLVEKILNSLGYYFTSEYGDSLEVKKKQIGYYDLCDATGMLLAYMNKFATLNKED